MEYVYAALLLHKVGKEINEENIKKVIEATGVDPDMARIKALVASLNNIDIDEAIKAATSMVTAAPAEAPKEEKKEEAPKKEEKEKKEEEKEEEALSGLSALFG